MISRLRDVAREHTGSVMIEFVLVLPVLLVVLFGGLQFGIFFFDYIALTNAAAAGARQFSEGRLDATVYTDTLNAINNATCNLSTSVCTLNSANLTITLNVDGAACASNSSCSTALTTAQSQKQPASVTLSYSWSNSCTSFMPYVNLAGVCPLTITLTERVQ